MDCDAPGPTSGSGASVRRDAVSFNGFWARPGRGSVAEAAAQREADHQRWADDGGPTPDVVVAAPAVVAPAAAAVSAWPPVRRVFRRRPAA